MTYRPRFLLTMFPIVDFARTLQDQNFQKTVIFLIPKDSNLEKTIKLCQVGVFPALKYHDSSFCYPIPAFFFFPEKHLGSAFMHVGADLLRSMVTVAEGAGSFRHFRFIDFGLSEVMGLPAVNFMTTMGFPY